MNINLTGTVTEILSSCPSPIREKEKQIPKNINSRIVALSQEENNESFALFYAFFKDDAFTRRLQIPTYHELLRELSPVRESSFILFATIDTLPVAALWLVISDSSAVIRQAGSIKLGYESQVDYYLLREALGFTKEKGLAELSFDEERLFRGMMNL